MSKNRGNPEPSIRGAETDLADGVTQRLRGALFALSPLERAILALHNGFAFSPAEVAKILDIEESQVACIVEELRPRLRDMGPLTSKNPGQAARAADRSEGPEDPGDDSVSPA